MLCSRCTLPILALALLLEEISAAVLPSRGRNRRDLSWLDQELFSHLPDRTNGGDLSVGDAGEAVRDVDGRPSHSETFLVPTDHLSLQHHRQPHRKTNEKKRKIAPLDSIGSFQMISSKNRGDEPNEDWEDNKD